jgi:metallo-beta-lactamase class B
VKDGGRSHLVAEWGGTMFTWIQQRARYVTAERNDRFWFDACRRSARRFRDIATRAGADGLISNHTNYDGSKRKLPALAMCKPGDPHPFVVGTDSVTRYVTVVEECATAGLLRLT